MGADVLVAINPTASAGRRGGVGEQVAERLRAAGHGVRVLQAEDAAALQHDLRRALTTRRPDALVVVGGDGIVNLALGLLARGDVPLGIVPTGTGNDAARGLGLPHDDVDAAVDRILIALADGAPSRRVDAVHLSNGRWFLGVLSAGFDAAVNERANRMRRPAGRSRYVVALLLEIARLKPLRYRVTIDRDPRQVDAVLVTVGNLTSIGGGMRITPGALADDGLLDVLIAAPLSRGALLRIFPRVFAGTHVLDEHVSVQRGRVVTLNTGDGAVSSPVAYADGERMGPLPLTLEVVPGALAVLGI